MLRISLADLHRPKFSTKISTGFVEIFDSLRDGNLTSEAAERPFQRGWCPCAGMRMAAELNGISPLLNSTYQAPIKLTK